LASAWGSFTSAGGASSIVREDFEYASEAVLVSLIPACWSTFSSRGNARVRSRICAKPSEIPELTDLGWRDEAGSDQVVRDQLADPRRVLGVGLARGNVAQVLGV
jgi:hypothetical protein